MSLEEEVYHVLQQTNSRNPRRVSDHQKNGLDENAVTASRDKYGENKLYEKKKKSVFMIFLEQFKDLLVIILIIAAIISMTTGNVESTAVIIAVLILNAILGTVQYVKAEKSLESLKSLSSPVAKVIRNGQPPRNRRQRPLSAEISSDWKPATSFRETDV